MIQKETVWGKFFLYNIIFYVKKGSIKEMNEYYVIHKKSRTPTKISTVAVSEYKGIKIKEKYRNKEEAEKHVEILNKRNPVGYKVSEVISIKEE